MVYHCIRLRAEGHAKMFRRFMIVCWVIFGILAVASGFAWKTFIDVVSDVSELTDAVLEHPAIGLEPSDPAYYDLEDAEGRTLPNLYRQQDWRIQDRDEWDAITGNIVFITFGFLLWIIVWHVGHWVWMGRDDAKP